MGISLKQLNENLKKVDLNRLKLEIADKSKILAANLNREQLMEGKNNLDDKITPDYSNFQYAVEKNQMNSKAGMFTPDLKDTGAFHNSIKSEPFLNRGNNIGLDFIATDEKAPFLTRKYIGVLGVTEDNEQRIINISTKALISTWLTRVGLGKTSIVSIPLR